MLDLVRLLEWMQLRRLRQGVPAVRIQETYERVIDVRSAFRSGLHELARTRCFG